MNRVESFDELSFFAQVKKQPGMYMSKKSLLSLRDKLFGMNYAFIVCGHPEALRLFKNFTEYYNNELLKNDQNGYACWWNHLLYISGGMDDVAFDSFFMEFEAYLVERQHMRLPDV